MATPYMDPAFSVRAASVSDQLHRAVAAQGRAECWVVYDPALVPLGEDAVTASWIEQGATVRTVPVASEEVDARFFPRWVHADTASFRGSWTVRQSMELALAELDPLALEQGGGRRVGGWLQTDGDPRLAAQHLGRCMVQRWAGGSSVLLRLQDPAVLWALWPLLDAQQQDALLGPISRWWLLDPMGQLVELARTAPTQPVPPLEFTPQQWQDIDNVQALNQALLQWRQEREDGAAQGDIERARQTAVAALRRARQYQLEHAQDLALFAWHALSVHPGFDQHDIIQSLLQKRTPETRYSWVVADVSQAQWDQIGANQNVA